MQRLATVLGMAALVGLVVGNAAYVVTRRDDPLIRALVIGLAAFVVMVAIYVLTSER